MSQALCRALLLLCFNSLLPLCFPWCAQENTSWRPGLLLLLCGAISLLFSGSGRVPTEETEPLFCTAMSHTSWLLLLAAAGGKVATGFLSRSLCNMRDVCWGSFCFHRIPGSSWCTLLSMAAAYLALFSSKSFLLARLLSVFVEVFVFLQTLALFFW